MNPQDPTAPPPFPTDGSVVLVEPNAYAGIQTAIADTIVSGAPTMQKTCVVMSRREIHRRHENA